MPKGMHEKISRDVRKAHPNYSPARVEREANAVMANIGKGYTRRGRGGKMTASKSRRISKSKRK